MARIFISYRRSDNAAGYSRSMALTLRKEFGDSEVFRDIRSIPPGQDFPTLINSMLDKCSVMLVLIGTQWLNTTGEDGHRRLDDPEDWVRREVAAALLRDILVVPVLVCGARMPALAELPDDLAALASRNAITMSDDDWEHDLGQLTQALRKHLQLPGTESQPAARVPTAHRSPASTSRVFADMIKDAMSRRKHESSRRPAGLGSRLLRMLFNWLRAGAVMGVIVWIVYTQNDEFATGVDRFIVRSGEMLARMFQ